MSLKYLSKYQNSTKSQTSRSTGTAGTEPVQTSYTFTSFQNKLIHTYLSCTSCVILQEVEDFASLKYFQMSKEYRLSCSLPLLRTEFNVQFNDSSVASSRFVFVLNHIQIRFKSMFSRLHLNQHLNARFVDFNNANAMF